MKKVLIGATVISFIEWFNKENVEFLRDELGCEVHIACDFEYMNDTDEERTKSYIQKLHDNGVILHQIDFDRSPFGKRNRKAYGQLKKLIEQTNFDLIHCHTPTASVLIRLAARKTRRRGTAVMYTCHGFHFHKAAPKKNWLFYYPVERVLSSFCDYLVTINKEDYAIAKTFRTKQVRYIPGVGVDVENIRKTMVDKADMKQSLGLPKDSLMILSVGELIERKNHEVIIRALAKMKRKDIYYVICGKGPLREHLTLVAEETGVSDRVLFLGFRTDIPKLCRTADMSAFPSKIEGLGLAGIEAMAAGIPVVSSNVHGIVDYVIDGETGFTCHPSDVDGFALKLEKLADDALLRKKMKDRCLRIVEQFELKNALNTMWDIYREILGDEVRGNNE